MQLTAQFTPLADVASDWLIAGVWQDEAPAGALAQLDERAGAVVGRLRQAGDVLGKPNELTPLLGLTGIGPQRVLLVGLGKRAAADRGSLHDAAAAAARAVTGKRVGRVA